MIRIIVKKEYTPNWLSLKMSKTYRFKIVGYIIKKYYELKGYDVEVIE